jgi:hypothetical protein
MRAAILFLVTLSVFASRGIAQTGTVTFYSIGGSFSQGLKASVVPTNVSFTGWLFDGPQRLAHSSAARFVTFNLAAGEHSFTVPYKAGGPGKDPILRLQVESGEHYCVRLSALFQSWILLPTGTIDSRIEQVSCQEAFRQAAKYKQIDLKRIDPAVRKELSDSISFPKPE